MLSPMKGLTPEQTVWNTQIIVTITYVQRLLVCTDCIHKSNSNDEYNSWTKIAMKSTEKQTLFFLWTSLLT